MNIKLVQNLAPMAPMDKAWKATANGKTAFGATPQDAQDQLRAAKPYTIVARGAQREKAR